MIDACAKQGGLEMAERWLQRMSEKNVEANVVTYTSLIDACAKRGDLELAEHWLVQKEKKAAQN